MSKLWIIHRNPHQRAALARLSGLVDSEILWGAPDDDGFADSQAPVALVLGLDGDFELELDFVHRHRMQLARTHWLVIAKAGDASEARRLFASQRPEFLEGPASAGRLRRFIAAALSQRHAASLVERQHRQRISERFSSWLGGIEVPGLLRALDPSLASLPLLVRGVRGSGRSLLCRYIEIFRGATGRVMRLHGRDLHHPEDLVERLRTSVRAAGTRPHSVWIDEIDSLSVSAQNAMAELIVHGDPEIGIDTAGLRWLATAGPKGLDDRLESSLQHAFAPLQIEIPALLDHPESLASFAGEVAVDWARSVGGGQREFADSALMTLEAHPWTGDRAELEAVLRTTLAASSREVIEDVDLRFPSDRAEAISATTFDPPAEIDPRAELDPIHSLIDVEVEVEAEVEAQADDGPVEAESEIEAAVIEGRPLGESESESESDPAEAVYPTTASFDPPSPAAKGTRSQPSADEGLSWRRLARSLTHEIRNPLVSIRTFAELLPDHFDDETFRARFTELVGRDVAHISDVLSRLSSITERGKTKAEAVDVSALIEKLLEDRRERIARGRLLVLRELERDAPMAWANAQGLQIALAGLLDRALESLPARGDLFVTTQHLERTADGKPKLRILLRHHNPARSGGSDPGLAEFDPSANILEYVLAEAVIASDGGKLTIDATDARETLILIDLQTPI